MARIILGLVLLDFSALTVWAVAEHGYVGVFEALLANAATITAGTDLVIALGLITVWMWRDAKARGRNVLPYVGLTALLGSIGPLAYLLLGDRDERVGA
jgi:hypothetical protein